MRISDRRYDRDRCRLAISYRLIGYGVRTELIRQVTGLSADRIRHLFQDYFLDEKQLVPGRPRGRPPRQMSFFRHSLQREIEAATLGSLLLACRLLRPSNLFERLPCGELERCCNVFDTFVELCPGTEISFEHAWYLSQTLALEDQYALVPCPSCQALWIRDLLVVVPAVCPSCRWPRAVAKFEKLPHDVDLVQCTTNAGDDRPNPLPSE
jgi:hypothetical protein